MISTNPVQKLNAKQLRTYYEHKNFEQIKNDITNAIIYANENRTNKKVLSCAKRNSRILRELKIKQEKEFLKEINSIPQNASHAKIMDTVIEATKRYREGFENHQLKPGNTQSIVNNVEDISTTTTFSQEIECWNNFERNLPENANNLEVLDEIENAKGQFMLCYDNIGNKQLDVNGKHLHSLPNKLDQLDHLKKAYFLDNLFTTIPTSLAKLPDGCNLNLSRNPSLSTESVAYLLHMNSQRGEKGLNIILDQDIREKAEEYLTNNPNIFQGIRYDGQDEEPESIGNRNPIIADIIENESMVDDSISINQQSAQNNLPLHNNNTYRNGDDFRRQLNPFNSTQGINYGGYKPNWDY